MAATASPEAQASAALAEFAATLGYDDLPAGVVQALKRMILDAIGTALAATTLGDGCRESMAVMARLGGPPESTILGLGVKVAAPNAAFANGALVHALNYDAIGRVSGHVGVACLAAPLAAAEAKGGVSGRDYLAATAAACEMTARITTAIARTGRKPSELFLSGQLLNYYAAAAGAGRALGLDPATMRSALGLALMQTAGSRQVVLSGDPPAKAIYGAFPNQAGVQAALLAEEGVGCDVDAVGAPAGLYALFYGGACDVPSLTDGLRRDYLLTGADIKPWPTSGHVHPFIEAAATIAATGLKAEDIEAVEVVAETDVRPWCEPLELRRRPENPASAANAIPFCVAKTLVHGDLGLADFTPAGLADADAHAIADRTTYSLEDGLEGGIVRVATRGGQRIEEHVSVALGDHTRPVSRERLVQKVSDCCAHALHSPDEARIAAIVAAIDGLEDLDDVRQLADLAACGPG